MTECLRGIDNGGTVAKAALFAADGRELRAARRKIELEMPQAGWREIDAGRLWQATAEVIRQVMEETGAGAADVAGVACTGHGSGKLATHRLPLGQVHEAFRLMETGEALRVVLAP